MNARIGIVLMIVFVAGCAASAPTSAPADREPPRMGSSDEPVAYVRLYADAEGDSHFRDAKVGLTFTDYAPPTGPLAASDPYAVSDVTFLRLPAGWRGDWHAAPRRQFAIFLSGKVEVEASDGDTMRFARGEVLFVEDTKGKGHVTRVIGDGPAVLAVVAVREE